MIMDKLEEENSKLKAELEISQKDVKQVMENWNDAVNQATELKAELCKTEIQRLRFERDCNEMKIELAQLQEDFEGEVRENDYRLEEENAKLKIENSYHADHTIYQGNCITCAEWEDTDRENETLKADLAQLQEDFEGEVKENDARLVELNKCRAAMKSQSEGIKGAKKYNQKFGTLPRGSVA